jgi:hypothetical protein
LAAPLHEVGALLDAKSANSGRSAANHLLWLADSNGIARSRVTEVLDTVGLSDVAGRRVGTFSLGAFPGPPRVVFGAVVFGGAPTGWAGRLLLGLRAEALA